MFHSSGIAIYISNELERDIGDCDRGPPYNDAVAYAFDFVERKTQNLIELLGSAGWAAEFAPLPAQQASHGWCTSGEVMTAFPRMPAMTLDAPTKPKLLREAEAYVR